MIIILHYIILYYIILYYIILYYVILCYIILYYITIWWALTLQLSLFWYLIIHIITSSACDVPHNAIYINCSESTAPASEPDQKSTWDVSRRGPRNKLDLESLGLDTSDVNVTVADRGVYLSPSDSLKVRTVFKNFCKVNKIKWESLVNLWSIYFLKLACIDISYNSFRAFLEMLQQVILPYIAPLQFQYFINSSKFVW